ncbi:glycosyltransferase family 2 protein [Dactylosporangium sp. CA-092794]|uniref:glycosyltransferase family 2 protein n=1 Tax=Dactylosporangium sp. CA-092794 TaxID=3239929 RepID=UPI003D8BED76
MGIDVTSAPAVVRDIELTEPIPALYPAGADAVWLIVRLWTEPLGMFVVPVPGDGVPAQCVAELIERRLREEIATRLVAAGFPAAPPQELTGLDPSRSPYLAERRRVHERAEPITVVVCTRDRPDGLRRCLESIRDQDYPAWRVLVVDNAPETGAARRVVAELADPRMAYVCEPRPGLSWARNRAIAEVTSGVLAWIDDDEVADRHWLSEVARALHRHPEAGCVTGVIVPAEVATKPQEWFEGYGGHSKGRGFGGSVHSPATAAAQSPLYPLPAFGAGGNMAFRREALVAIGGFDTALGAGTAAMGAEDTLAFTLHLLGGGTIVYHPPALVRHYHRRDLDGLTRQMRGYGVGLGAFYTRLLLDRPALLLPLLRLFPAALRSRAGRSDGVPSDFPPSLLAANQRGLLAGPGAYLRARRAARRLRTEAAR